MLARISLMLLVIAGLCTGAFTLGGKATARQGDSGGIPPEHPVALALRFRQELCLSPDQVAKLDQMRVSLAAEFGPFRAQAEAIMHRMQEMQQSGKQDENAAKALQRENDDLAAKMQPVFERYGKSVAQLLSPDQQGMLGKLAHQSQGPEFVMMFVMQARDQLGISPQQFTKLQYLQADFIRAFAPLREQMELLQMEVQEKFGKAGKEPSSDYRDKFGGIQKQIMELQAKFSERTIKDVLQPNQRAMLGELMRGQHRPSPNGG